MAKLSKKAVREILTSQSAKYTPRSEIASEYGIDLSTVFRVLRGEHVYTPRGYAPDQLAPTPEKQKRQSSHVTLEQVGEIRATVQERYVPTRVLAEKYQVSTGVIRALVKNETWHDPEYDPAKNPARETIPVGQIRTEGYIYGVKCRCRECSGRIRYVGQTVQAVSERWKAHRDSSRRTRGAEYHTQKSKWVRDHGADLMETVILQTDPENGLDKAEVDWIKRLNTLHPHGFNMTPGGYSGAGRPGQDNPGAKLSEEQVKSIIREIHEDPTATSYTLAEKYGVTKTLILKIDKGELWPFLERPYGHGVLGARNPRKPTTPEMKATILELSRTGTMSVSHIANKLGITVPRVKRVLEGAL